jgi:hypothetical protein
MSYPGLKECKTNGGGDEEAIKVAFNSVTIMDVPMQKYQTLIKDTLKPTRNGTLLSNFPIHEWI